MILSNVVRSFRLERGLGSGEWSLFSLLLLLLVFVSCGPSDKKEYSDAGQVLVGMISISLTVLLLDVLFRLLENLLLPWQRDSK